MYFFVWLIQSVMPFVRCSGPPSRPAFRVSIVDDDHVAEDNSEAGSLEGASPNSQSETAHARRVSGGDTDAASRPSRKRNAGPKGMKSIVPGMTVGEVRILLNQLWRTRWVVKPEYMLTNGMTVGEFCLKYALGLLAQRKQKTAKPKRPKAL